MNPTISILIATAMMATAAPAFANAAQDRADAVRYRAAETLAKSHLAKFDTLDFDVFSNQNWKRLKESHAPDIAVHWPDGRIVRGIDRHVSDLKALFTYAPDTRIKQHPVKIGSGEWTSVVGVMEGTFTKPMTLLDGTVIQPTGRKFALPMSTVGHWRNGVMDEEYLFWDSATYMAQLGIGK